VDLRVLYIHVEYVNYIFGVCVFYVAPRREEEEEKEDGLRPRGRGLGICGREDGAGCAPGRVCGDFDIPSFSINS
jgi:hypothetical protein